MATSLKPLARFIVQNLNEVDQQDIAGIKKATRKFYNKRNNGSIPRGVVVKIGKHLYIDMEKWSIWIEKRRELDNKYL